MEQFIYGNIRVQLLSDKILRVELGKNGKFCDENTLNVPERARFAKYGALYTAEENAIFFGEYELYLPEDASSLKGLKLERNGKRVYTYKRISNTGELPPAQRTPEAFAVADCPRITLPEGGYAYRAEKNSGYTVDERAQDIYLLLCEGDAKRLRRLYTELTGRCELVRLSTLGCWNSKYFVYSEESAKELILDYEKRDVPLDVMVIDTDWRAASDRGIGYEIDTRLFPDMKRFLDFAHAHGVEIMFNDHPEPAEGARDVFDPAEVSYREEKLQSLLSLGVDIWWYDRNWHTKLKSPTKGVHPETLGMYLFSDITAHYYQMQAGSREIYRRPVIMGNADDVANGEYIGISSSASHRFSIQWTGDIGSDFGVLAGEIYNMLRCSDNCIAYVNSDCGGHNGNPNKEEYIRWVQFGTLSPVFRPHCTKDCLRMREPWLYDEETLRIAREHIKLRYRLLPVLYGNAYNNYLTGEPIFRGLYWEYPEDERAAACIDEYLLGKNLLIAPVAGDCKLPLAAEDYVAPVSATFFSGKECKGEELARATFKTLELSVNGTSPVKGVPPYDFSAVFETAVRFSEERELYIKCDDGATVFLDGKKVLEDRTEHSATVFPLGRLSANEKHTVRVEYFQAGGEAYCALLSAKAKENAVERAVYLPEGKWLSLFDGACFAGGTDTSRRYGIDEMPLFVRLGALIPLARNARNTKEQRWDKLVYDFYPCKEATDSGCLYEDDGETTAYRLGQCRKSGYEAYFNAKDNAFVVKLHAAEGSFAGERCFEERAVKIKYHVFEGCEASRVTVNGRETQVKRTERTAGVFPLCTEDGAADADTLTIAFATDVCGEYEICFYLKEE